MDITMLVKMSWLAVRLEEGEEEEHRGTAMREVKGRRKMGTGRRLRLLEE